MNLPETISIQGGVSIFLNNPGTFSTGRKVHVYSARVSLSSQLSPYKTCLSVLVLVKEHFIGMFVKLLTEGEKKRILPSPPPPPPAPLSPSHQVRKTSEHSPLPATFAHCPHSSSETQYLTIDKQLTHLFFWGTR